MYLPGRLVGARVLVTVKTYPLPSGKYGELVCTAGLLDGNKWIRIYPIPLSFLSDDIGYPKYSWIGAVPGDGIHSKGLIVQPLYPA